MLRELNIKNFAIIDQVSVEFAAGLNVISGETGSGKSVIITALELVLGGKASPEYIRSGTEQMQIEADFHLTKDSLKQKLTNHGIISNSEDDSLVLRRRITRQGKSSCYANDSLISLAVLNDIGRDLVDIHGQHQHQLLLQSENHVDFLDCFADLLEKRQQLTDLFSQWQDVQRKQAQFILQKEQQNMRRELLNFQIQEIDQANLQSGEEEGLKTERNLLINANKILEAGNWIYQALYDSEGSVSEILAGTENKLRDLSRLDPKLVALQETAGALKFQTSELASSINDYLSKIEYNPSRLDEVEERLTLIEDLKRKYGQGIEQILNFREKAAAELEQISQIGHDAATLAQMQKDLVAQLNQNASDLSQKRHKAALELESKLEQELIQLGMLQATVKVRFLPLKSDCPDYSGNAYGLEGVEFLFSANPGEEPKPLAKVASGGELSRIMLVLKSLLAGRDQVGSLAFDEVDTGIGGKVADVVGRKLKESSTRQQVICITHLPQIAALGNQHFAVSKEINGGQTFTRITKLNVSDRIREIARMLAGSEITPSALTHAEKMLNAAD